MPPTPSSSLSASSSDNILYSTLILNEQPEQHTIFCPFSKSPSEMIYSPSQRQSLDNYFCLNHLWMIN
ncbi:hypothetical protein P5673_016026 [Acropora cervicornis]|uniref:Uncharacterized protein n=1 Tax=Acropora cervicornis TaxID=6130 RepID=A0AAD9V4H0_ACRCE|nr:hypothetical protein P5673_016026 [Acropora cervicornis]